MANSSRASYFFFFFFIYFFLFLSSLLSLGFLGLGITHYTYSLRMDSVHAIAHGIVSAKKSANVMPNYNVPESAKNNFTDDEVQEYVSQFKALDADGSSKQS